MINIEKRRQDFLNLIEMLDISHTMYRIASERYKNMAYYLQDKGLDIDVYPQGSFSLGTVVRPYKNSSDTSYDLDFICLLDNEKSSITPKAVKEAVGDALKSDEEYKKKMQKEWDRCWTLEYAEISDIGFNMDIVPAVREEVDIVERLITLNVAPEASSTAIAITNKDGVKYSWCQSNPKGYKLWFDSINEPFLEFNREEKRKILFESHKDIYASIEDIPKELERSSMQRVIQILKRHRDVWVARGGKEVEKYKPLSAIITTVVAQISETAPKSYDVFSLLKYVVYELQIYAEKLKLNEEEFNQCYSEKKVINRKSERWEILNPVNPEDNLADSWNAEPKKAEYFFKWVKQVESDFVHSFGEEDRQFICILENSLGSNFVNKGIDTRLYNAVQPTPITFTPKPWRL